MKTCQIALCLLLVLVGCTGLAPGGSRGAATPEDTRPVIADYLPTIAETEIINHLVSALSAGRGNGTVVLRDETTVFGPARNRSIEEELRICGELVRREMPGFDPAAFEDYRARNRCVYRFAPETGRFLAPAIWYSSIAAEHKRRLDAGEDYWTSLRGIVPRLAGVLTLSAVGFNEAADKAFVYAAVSSGFTSGRGDYLYLEKRNGRWEVVLSALRWIS